MVVNLLITIWLIGVVISFVILTKRNNMSKFECVWFSMLWFVMIVLYPIHYIYNKFRSKEV